VAASPRLAARPSLTVSRTATVAVAVAAVVVLSLRFIHPLPELAIVAFAPALLSLALAGASRRQYQQNARVAALATGLAGAAWLIVSSGRDEPVVAVLIGAMVSSLLMMGLAMAGAMVIDRVQGRRASSWKS
jgi:hypothetical protein